MSTAEIPMVECSKCGFQWQKRVPRPTKCPNCQSRNWDGNWRTETIVPGVPEVETSDWETEEELDSLGDRLARLRSQMKGGDNESS